MRQNPVLPVLEGSFCAVYMAIALIAYKKGSGKETKTESVEIQSGRICDSLRSQFDFVELLIHNEFPKSAALLGAVPSC
jgi:hypothetical protein